MTTTSFLGACTPRGFLSRFDQLFTQAERLTILKGGCGCGKSTFMRTIAEAAEARGLDTERILCSSDPDSLDGLLIPALQLAFVDGTAPHVLEPRLCGGRMNYLNFGEFYDRAAMAPNEEAVLQEQAINSAQYPLVTACLSAARRVLDCLYLQTAGDPFDEELASIGECLALSALRPVGTEGQVRHRFLSVLTPKGPRFCLGNLPARCSRIYILQDSYGLGPRVLTRLLQKALAGGHQCIAGYSSMEPDVPGYLLIPTADAAILTVNPRDGYDGPSVACLDLDSTLPPQLRGDVGFALQTARDLQLQAVHYLHKAKDSHDRMEALCRPFVDYRAVSDLTRKTIQTLFS